MGSALEKAFAFISVGVLLAVLAVSGAGCDDGGAASDAGIDSGPDVDGEPVLDSGPPDAACLTDTDGDTVPDCIDEDDDDDGLTDEVEAGLGTDPLDPDSDHDGLDDGEEENTLSTDPTKPTLFVEVDYMTGGSASRQPTSGTLDIATQSFAASGIDIAFAVDDSDTVSEISPLSSDADMESVLSGSKNPALPHHLHVVFADVGSATEHGTTHYPNLNNGTFGNAPDPKYAGSFVFAGQIAADYATYTTELTGAGISQDHLMARTLVHEIGHMIGCTHEGGTGGLDTTNVMAPNSALGPMFDPDLSRWKDGTLGAGWVGYPTFNENAEEQMDLSFKASVETGGSPSVRTFDFGTADSPVGVNTYRVTESTAFDPSVGYGWDAPLPTVASTQGSDSGDPRTGDYVSGDPATEGDIYFRISALGTEATMVFIRLGATTTETLNVRCELRHPDYGVAYLQGTISPGTPYLQTSGSGVRSFPVIDANSLGFGRADLLLRCIDDDTHDDAPIEYVKVTKEDP